MSVSATGKEMKTCELRTAGTSGGVERQELDATEDRKIHGLLVIGRGDIGDIDNAVEASTEVFMGSRQVAQPDSVQDNVNSLYTRTVYNQAVNSNGNGTAISHHGAGAQGVDWFEDPFDWDENQTLVARHDDNSGGNTTAASVHVFYTEV